MIDQTTPGVRLGLAWLLVALALSLVAPAPASALSLHSGICDLPSSPGDPSVVEPPPGVVSDLLLGEGIEPRAIHVDGNVILHVPDPITLPALEIRAMGSVIFEGVLGITTDSLIVLTGSQAVPFLDPDSEFAFDRFRIAFAGTTAGPLRIFSTGDVRVTPDPVPESGTGLLLALGLGMLAARRSRTSTRSESPPPSPAPGP